MEQQSIEFHYLKSASFRTSHADGAFGGPTPQGGVFISFYLERPPIPQLIAFELGQDGRLGLETRREGRAGMVREIDCGITMSLSTAKAVAEWLGQQIRTIEQTTPPPASS